MMGRVPGSVGMERAREYCAFTFESLGVGPAFGIYCSWRYGHSRP